VTIVDSSGYLRSSSVTPTQLTNFQSQIDGKQASITGAATTVVSSDLTVSRALVSDANGKIAVSTVNTALLQSLGGIANFRVVVTDTNSRFAGHATVGTGQLDHLAGVTTNCQTARVLRFDLPTTASSWIYLGAYSATQGGRSCNISLSLTKNNNADNNQLLKTEIQFLNSNGSATQPAMDNSLFMGAARVVGHDLQVRIRQSTTSMFQFYYFNPATPGIGTCTIQSTGGVFTYSGTSTTEPTDKYIQPAPRNPNYFVAGRCLGSTVHVVCDYGEIPFTLTRSSTGFYIVTFAAANPRGSSYVAMCQGSLLSQVSVRTSTSMQIITMDQFGDVMDSNFDFFVLN
jgi:hypothetical protein